MKFLEMQFGSVSLVLTEAILRETRAKFPHQRVARHLRDHTRRRDAQTEAIAINDRCLRKGKWKNWQPIDQDVLRRNRQADDRDSHRLVGGAQDIDTVNLDGIDDPDRPNDLGVIRQVFVNFFTQLRRKLFRIV